MHSASIVLLVSVFLASAVEMVEALTIVVAVGVTRGWRSALEGAAVALGVLVALVVAIGPALVHYVPLDGLRVAVGALLLVFGLQWLRKALLRPPGLKSKHDEDAIFTEHVAELEEPAPGPATTDGLHRGLQGGVPRGPRGGGDRPHPGGQPITASVWPLWAPGPRSWSWQAWAPWCRATRRCARERHEDGRRHHAGELRHLLGGEGVGVRWPGSELALPVLVGVYAMVAWATVSIVGRADRAGVEIA